MKLRIIGTGRAGRSFHAAFRAVGIDAEILAGRSSPEELARTAKGVDGVLIAVADRFVGEIATAIGDGTAVLCHCSGSLGLEALGPAGRKASLHPLVTLPDPGVGSLRLRAGAFFAVSGDPLATDIALALGGRPIVVEEPKRTAYHAAACVAANHLVALTGQVQRIAESAGLPLEAFLPLARGALDDVAMLGPAGALTGPASRGDDETIEEHRKVLARDELEGYDAGVELARLLVRAKAAPVPASPWS